MENIKRKVSMQDIADYLGVSKNAVSLALNNKPGVSEDLRKKIIQAAQELNYSGLKVADKKISNNILLLIPGYIRNDPFFYTEIYWSIEKAAQKRGYNVVITSVTKTMEENLQLPELYHEMEFCGILSIGVLKKDYIKMIQQTDLPFILVDHCYDDIQLDAVVTANGEGAYSMVNYLIDNGHEEIGYVGSIKMTASLYERWLGYNKAMTEHGLKVKEEYCIINSSPLDDLLADPDELGEYIDRMEKFPTAWFCGGDRVALALINALSKRNIRVPEEVSVAGFDDIDAARFITPALTTIQVKRKQMAEEAVDYLIRRMKSDGVKAKIELYGELIVRDSVKQIK